MSSSNSPERARRPLIGVTGRRSSAERLAVEPRYRHPEFDMHYSDFPTRLSSEGALVVQIPYEASGIDLIERLDGIVISGGQDVHPETLGIDATPTDPDSDPRRDAYEIELIWVRTIRYFIAGCLSRDADAECGIGRHARA